MSEPLIRLAVQGRPPDFHHGKHMNRWHRAALVRDRRNIVRALALGARHLARVEACPPSEPRLLAVTVRWRGVRRDDINLMQDLKADVDGLVDAGWLADDKRRLLTWQFPPDYERAATEREIAVVYSVYRLAAQ